MNAIDSLLDSIAIPDMVRVRQIFPRPQINDLEGHFVGRLEESRLLESIKPGARVAIAVGSRGVSNQPLFVKLLAGRLKAHGAQPFVVPAMGSHGGASAEGQKGMLEGMGVTEEYTGVPIRATMEVVQVGATDDGLPAYIDRYAHEADATVIINRVKPHVAFRGDFESGLMKMVVIGLGKQRGADACHDLGFGEMAKNIPAIGRITLCNSNIVFGVGLLENAYHETCRIEFLDKGRIEETEPGLQSDAKELLPKIYFEKLDVLIIDEIGKDISGTGFDTNVVGRFHTPYAYGFGSPEITRLAILNLTDKSHGNANGVGIADFTTQRVFDKLLFEQTYPNALTSTVPISVKIPMVLKNDRQAIQAAIKTCNRPDKKNVLLARVRNTMRLDEIEVSANLIDLVDRNGNTELVGRPYSFAFNEAGNLF